MEQPQVNQEYVVQSLTNQVARLSLGNAERDAIITEQQQRIQALENELDELRKAQLDAMDGKSDAE